jgi:hypothetical protein
MKHLRISLELLLATALGPGAAAADTLLVRTLDPASGLPIAGAFVLVGPREGAPFPGNTGLTGANGIASFSHPGLVGPQIVTAGTADRAYVSITAAPLAEVTLYLPLRAVADTLPAPVARVTGRGLNIATQSNDGSFDIGFALPALDVDALVGSFLLGGGAVPFAVPPDTAYFPAPIGTTAVPGIMTMPAQTELLFLVFQKPVYKIDLPDQTTQSLFCLSGRIALADLLSISGNDIFAALNAFSMREVGIERNLSISNGAVVDVNVDLNLAPNLVLTFGNVPPASKISAGSAARIREPAGERYLLYDGKSALIDLASTLTLASMNPSGDLADAVNTVVATHGDSAASPEFLSGIVRRDGFTVPANITVASFMLSPLVTQNGDTFTFTDATNPGISPSPTWAQGAFQLADVPGGSGVAATTHWIVYTPAPELGFTLPALPAAAPPALPDTASTPEADRLRLTLAVNNQTGDAQAVLESPFGDATHFATRTVDVQRATTGLVAAEAAPLAAPRLGRAYPDPFHPNVNIPVTAVRNAPVTVVIYSTAGRAVRALTAPATAGATSVLVWDGRDEHGVPLASGVYIARLASAGARAGAEEKLVLLR